MRSMLVIVVALLTAGCTAMLRAVSLTPSPNYAFLSLRAAGGSPLGVILDVDGYEVANSQGPLYVARGRRSIGYICPEDVMVIDGFSELKYEFVGGKRYELVCDKAGASIHVLPD